MSEPDLGVETETRDRKSFEARILKSIDESLLNVFYDQQVTGEPEVLDTSVSVPSPVLPGSKQQEHDPTYEEGLYPATHKIYPGKPIEGREVSHRDGKASEAAKNSDENPQKALESSECHSFGQDGIPKTLSDYEKDFEGQMAKPQDSRREDEAVRLEDEVQKGPESTVSLEMDIRESVSDIGTNCTENPAMWTTHGRDLREEEEQEQEQERLRATYSHETLIENDAVSFHDVQNNTRMELEDPLGYNKPFESLMDEDTPGNGSIVEEVVHSILTPGISGRVLQMMHLSFIGLLLTLFVLFVLTGSGHALFLLIVNVLLWLSLTWFVQEMGRQEQLHGLVDKSKKEE